MKICLIRPPIVVPAQNITSMFTPPVGLAYVAGALREAGHAVDVIDGVGESLETRHPAPNDCYIYGLSLEQVVERVPEDAGIIGVSAGFSFEWPTCRDLVAMLRARFPDVLLIGGGEHMTAMPEASLEGSALDLGVLGEGEETAVELADAVAAGSPDLSAIQGIVYKEADGTITLNPRRPRKRAIDDIALPAWDLVPIEEYLDRGFGFGVNRGRSMPLVGSRGCPYQCTFCSNPQMWTTRWVPRDADLLLDEIESYQKKYGAQNFDFYDLTAIVKKSWIIDFCNKIHERGLTFTWQLPSGTRSEAIDEEVARALYGSGCRNLSYSPESGSPSVLTRIKKKIKTDSVIESIAGCVRAGLNIKTNIMLGFPGETYKEVFESYRFIIRMALAGAHDLSVWAFSPYPGSELFTQLREAGRVETDNDAYFDSLRSYADASRTVSYSENIPDQRLKTLRFIGLCLFYGTSWLRRPIRPFRIIRNVMRGTQESRAELGLANLLRRRHLSQDGSA